MIHVAIRKVKRGEQKNRSSNEVKGIHPLSQIDCASCIKRSEAPREYCYHFCDS